MAYDIEQVRKVINQSSALSAIERAEWLQLLPDMNEQQVGELLKILSPQAPAPLPPQPKVDIKQKEIGTSIPFYEPEIPAHAGVPAPAHAAEAKPVAVQQKKPPTPPDPSELQKRVASIVEELESRRQGKYTPPPQAPSPTTSVAAPVSAPPAAPKDIEAIALKSADDFAKIRAAHLHGSNFSDELKKIYDSMVIIGKKSSIYDVVQKFEQSALYRTYIETGIALLNDSNADREVAYGNVVKTLQAKGAEFLSKEEFEQFADFRKSLEQIL
jgi:hypothetical protein